MFSRIPFLIGLIGCLAMLPGCATDETYRAHQEAGGSLPWNRPQSWEGPASMGGSQMGGFGR